MYAKQGSLLDKTVDIKNLNEATNIYETIPGICVRNDVQYPFITIFRLVDMRYVLSTECRYDLRDYKAEHIEQIDNYQKGFEIPT